MSADFSTQGRSPKTNAAIVRLRNTSGAALGAALKGILAEGEALEEVAGVIVAKMSAGDYVRTELLAELIGRTKSHSLYKRAQPLLHADDWALLALYRYEFPEPKIELDLCQRLYDSASNDADPRRSYIAEAMRDVGSAAVLPTLEAIQFDHAPALQVKQVVARAAKSVKVGGLDAQIQSLRADGHEKFLLTVAQAITAISRRNST